MPRFPVHSYGTEEMARWMIPAMMKRMETKADATNIFAKKGFEARESAFEKAAEAGTFKPSPEATAIYGQEGVEALSGVSQQAAATNKQAQELKATQIVEAKQKNQKVFFDNAENIDKSIRKYNRPNSTMQEKKIAQDMAAKQAELYRKSGINVTAEDLLDASVGRQKVLSGRRTKNTELRNAAWEALKSDPTNINAVNIVNTDLSEMIRAFPNEDFTYEKEKLKELRAIAMNAPTRRDKYLTALRGKDELAQKAYGPTPEKLSEKGKLIAGKIKEFTETNKRPPNQAEINEIREDVLKTTDPFDEIINEAVSSGMNAMSKKYGLDIR